LRKKGRKPGRKKGSERGGLKRKRERGRGKVRGGETYPYFFRRRNHGKGEGPRDWDPAHVSWDSRG